MTTLTVALFIARFIVGAYVLVHGVRNSTSWLGGEGIKDTARTFAAGGLRGGVPAAAIAGLTQVRAGALLILGLATPLAAMCVVGVMAVATSVHASHGATAVSMLLGIGTAIALRQREGNAASRAAVGTHSRAGNSTHTSS